MSKEKSQVKFYKAYKLWKETLDDDYEYKRYKKSLNNKTSGDNFLKGFVGNKILDMDWVERVEDALPNLDKVIRESRSYIEQRDEVVPVEKVKKITTQSIRHLAQNTHMIAKVEDNGEVLPNKILNIYHESSLSIYENRFLITLLKKLSEFVENVYNGLKNEEEKIEVDYKIDKFVKRKDKLAKMNLDFTYNTNASLKFDAKDDPKSLPGFVRVIRMRSILQDFFSTTLVKTLKDAEPVRPPIIRTNLMTKNTDFRKCLELYEYLNGYRGIGYSYQKSEFDGEMPKKIENNLFDVFIFTNFVNEITFNPSFEKGLNRAFREKQREEQKKQTKRKNEWEDQIRQEERKKADKKIKRKEKSFQRKLAESEKVKENFKQRYQKAKQKYDDLLKKYEKQKILGDEVKVAGYTRSDGVKVPPYIRKKKRPPKKEKSDEKIIKVEPYTRSDGVKVSGYTYKVKNKKTSKKDEEYKTINVPGYTKSNGTKVSGYKRKVKVKDPEKNKKEENKVQPKYKFVVVDGYIRKGGVKVSTYTKKVPIKAKKQKEDKK